MRVRLWPDFGKESGQGGIKRVNEALNKWLPHYGVEVVSDIKEADVVNVHADRIKTDKPIALSNHGLYWQGYDWQRWSYEANAKLVAGLRDSSVLSVPSRYVHNVFARGALLDPFVLYHGIELDEWTPIEKYGYVYWGKTRIDPICDPTPLNELARLCPELPFVTTFGDNLPNITHTGKMNYDRAREVLRRASVYLATTRETGGITVLEALASGIPALGFDHGVNPEIIRHKETGFLAPVGDYAALREGLYYILENRERLAENAREFVRDRHQWRDRVRDYIPFFETAISTNQPVKPTVSVIVTAYNLESYLPACLDSILRQGFEDWECIIVDDASPDSCGRIADDYAKRDSRFKVIHNHTNQYLAEARNLGIRASSGKYILALDADDEAGDNALGILAQSLENDLSIDIATGSFELIEPDGRHWVSTWPSDTPTYDLQIKHRNQVPYASMYRRWVWERTGGYRRRWKSAEDAEFWTRAMSYGAVPAKVTDVPTLVYNNRPNSMSHVTKEPNWTSWFPWAIHPQFTPFAASGTPPVGMPCRPIPDYNPPRVSVIIPVGPKHDVYLQDSIDSIVAQTFQDWECIVVNDTGKTWLKDGKVINPHLAGYPFVKIVDSGINQKPQGPASARNRGIEAASAPAFVLLDADDYAQPLFLDVLYKHWQTYGGWAYCDWYDQEGNLKQAQEFDFDRSLQKMPGPSTGIYGKADWELVGGFDEDAAGWEDYIYILSLMNKGICGERIRYPGFTYRYHTGTQREADFADHKELLKYIHNKFEKLYENGEHKMACRKCGGGKVVPMSQDTNRESAEMVLVEYIGAPDQKRRLRSKYNPREMYIFGAGVKRFYAYAADIPFLTSMAAQFKIINTPVVSQNIDTSVAPVLVSNTASKEADLPLEALVIDPIVIGILRHHFKSVNELKIAGRSKWLAIKGIGATRADSIEEAINAL